MPIDDAKAGRGRSIFEQTCARCHGTYGPDGVYPNKIIPLEQIGTDPARSMGLSDRLVAHYNTTWFGAEHPVETKRVGYQAPPLDGIWASAPTCTTVRFRPSRSARLVERARRGSPGLPRPISPITTRRHVGWKFSEVTTDELASTAKRSPFQAKFIVDTSRFGMGNAAIRSAISSSDAGTEDVIEYLKTL